MTLAELITDLKAAGANENTVRLAMNCYQLGREEVVFAGPNEFVQMAIECEREAIKNAIGSLPVIVSELPAITKVMALIHARGQV